MPSFGFHVRLFTVSPGAGAATARSSAILTLSCNPPEYGAAPGAPAQKVRTDPFSLPGIGPDHAW